MERIKIYCDECEKTVYDSIDERRFVPYVEYGETEHLCEECYDKIHMSNNNKERVKND